MKIWTENDMEPVIKVIDDEIRHPYRSGARTRLLMIDLYHAITGSGHEGDDLTIYGYRVGDLVPLVWALRVKGVQAEEIEDWSRELRQMRETMQTAMSAELTDICESCANDLMERIRKLILSPDVKEKPKKEAKWSVAKIADEMRCSQQTVRNILRACMAEDLKKEEDDGRH